MFSSAPELHISGKTKGSVLKDTLVRQKGYCLHFLSNVKGGPKYHSLLKWYLILVNVAILKGGPKKNHFSKFKGGFFTRTVCPRRLSFSQFRVLMPYPISLNLKNLGTLGFSGNQGVRETETPEL